MALRRSSDTSMRSYNTDLGTAIDYVNMATDAYQAAQRLNEGWKKTEKRRKSFSDFMKNAYGGKASGPMGSGPLPLKKLKKSGLPYKKRGVATGRYSTKVRPKKRRRKGDVKKEKYMKHGYVRVSERHGLVTDPDCVYVGQSTYNLDEFPYIIMVAMLRHLFRIAGLDIDKSGRILPITQSGLTTSAEGVRIVLTGINETSGAEEVIRQIDSGPASTLDTLVRQDELANTALFQTLRDLLVGGGTTPLQNWARLSVYYLQGTPQVMRLMASMNLADYSINLWSKTHLKIQNRTKGATSGDVEADAVDNQPLYGYVYQFNAGNVSTVEIGGQWNTNAVRSDGLVIRKGALLGQPFKEPQPPKVFKNCIKSAKCGIQPGDIKSSTIDSVFKGNFKDVVRRLRGNLNTGVNNNGVLRAPGKVQLWALEEIINSGSDQNITVQYEKESIIGCYFKKSKKPLMLMDWQELNIPAP